MAHLHGSPKMVNGSIGLRAAETPRNDCSGLPSSKPSVRIRLASFCLETLSNGRCAVIDRAYSVDSATVGAVYDRPICSFETETSYEGLPSLDRMRERL